MGQHESAERRIPSGAYLHDWVERRGLPPNKRCRPISMVSPITVDIRRSLNRQQFGLSCWGSQDCATRLGQRLNAVMCVERAINRRQMDLYRPDRQPEATCDRLGGTAFC